MARVRINPTAQMQTIAPANHTAPWLEKRTNMPVARQAKARLKTKMVST